MNPHPQALTRCWFKPATTCAASFHSQFGCRDKVPARNMQRVLHAGGGNTSGHCASLQAWSSHSVQRVLHTCWTLCSFAKLRAQGVTSGGRKHTASTYPHDAHVLCTMLLHVLLQLVLQAIHSLLQVVSLPAVRLQKVTVNLTEWAAFRATMHQDSTLLSRGGGGDCISSVHVRPVLSV